jgi:hypothetical protein
VYLTILTVCPTELDESYLRLYREALLRWNQEGLAETQVILLPQKPLNIPTDPFEVVEVDFPRVAGYPVWDLMASVRKAWPIVRGEYVSFDHPEFIWGPDRLDRTIAFLRGYRPVYGLGNLRRPGGLEELQKQGSRDDLSQPASDWLRRFLDAGRWAEGAEAFEYIESQLWMYWVKSEQKPGPTTWIEDASYLRKDWLDLWGFTAIDMEMPFQDVYDLLQVAVSEMVRHGVGFPCIRMPQSVNKLVHLWHPRTWGSWTPEMRDWFMSQPERWRHCSLGNRAMWNELIEFARAPRKDCKPVGKMRFGPRGTALNYACRVADWLRDGGIEAMDEYFAQTREAGLA